MFCILIFNNYIFNLRIDTIITIYLSTVYTFHSIIDIVRYNQLPIHSPFLNVSFLNYWVKLSISTWYIYSGTLWVDVCIENNYAQYVKGILHVIN